MSRWMWTWVVLGCLTATVHADVLVAHVDQDRERALENKVNAERVTAGLPPLVHDDDLRELARYHSADMAMTGFVGPVSPSSGSLVGRAAREAQVPASRIRVALQRDAEAAPDRRVTRVALGIVAIGDRTYVTQIGVVDDAAPTGSPSLLAWLDRVWSVVAQRSVLHDSLYVIR